MGYKKYEIKITFVIDDYVEDIMDQVEKMKHDIDSGLAQRKLLEIEGIVNVKSTFKQIK